MPCTRNPNGDRMEYTTADSFTRDTLLGARLRDSGTCISSVAWSDFHAPRTDAPVRFMYHLSNAYTYRQARSKSLGGGRAFLGYRA